jgi:sugar lactone lactonase YvrE
MTLRLLLLFAGLLLSLPGQAQPRLLTTRVAEQAANLARPHDAALSADGKFLYVTDMANSRIVILEAMTLKKTYCAKSAIAFDISGVLR